ncbi:MAG: hypothetical protein ACK4M6_06290 [Hyphomonas sp.]
MLRSLVDPSPSLRPPDGQIVRARKRSQGGKGRRGRLCHPAPAALCKCRRRRRINQKAFQLADHSKPDLFFQYGKAGHCRLRTRAGGLPRRPARRLAYCCLIDVGKEAACGGLQTRHLTGMN